MTNNFIESGGNIRITSGDSMRVHTSLPCRVYTVEINPNNEELFLQNSDQFSTPSRIYGDIETNAKRIINTYVDRSSNTGVLLVGEKGSGKTLLAKYTASLVLKLGAPVILVNKTYDATKLAAFLQSITQDCMVFFDEFDKMYGCGLYPDDEESNNQYGLLTLLDGVMVSKKLFMFTCNNVWAVSDAMHNRPGRIFYRFDFAGLSGDAIAEYCKDNLKNTKFLNEIHTIRNLFSFFTFDMLKALVEEVNRYNVSPLKAVKILNMVPNVNKGSFKVSITDLKTKKNIQHEYSGRTVSVDMFRERILGIDVNTVTRSGEQKCQTIAVYRNQLQKADGGTFVYLVDKKYNITFTPASSSYDQSREMWDMANGYGDL